MHRVRVCPAGVHSKTKVMYRESSVLKQKAVDSFIFSVGLIY